MCKCNLCDMLSRIEDIGIVREKLSNLLDEQLLDNRYLSKQNEYWNSKQPEESAKLHDVRCFLNGLKDRLWEIMDVLDKTEEDDG